MLHHIKGVVTEKTPAYAVIESNGIGYQLSISINTYSALPESGTCTLFTEQLYIRDDMPKSYGFYTREERQLFRHLVSVSGVGGASALMMLSSLSATEIEKAILSGDVSTLKSIKGIGEKTAQRIIVDLKGKFGKSTLSGDFLTPAHNNKRDEALSALVMLGFAKNVAEKSLEKALKSAGPTLTVEELVKTALKNM